MPVHKQKTNSTEPWRTVLLKFEHLEKMLESIRKTFLWIKYKALANSLSKPKKCDLILF